VMGVWNSLISHHLGIALYHPRIRNESHRLDTKEKNQTMFIDQLSAK